MANRLIGVEITPRNVRLAVLGQHRGTATVIALEQRSYAEGDELPGLLDAMVPGGFQLSDRVITTLSAGQAYTRTLQFPFRDRKKVLAAAPFELASQLPVMLDDCQVATLTPQLIGDGAKTTAAAVSRAEIEALLLPFEQSRAPLQIIDLMPHALAGGIGDAVGTGLLACITEREALLACLLEGQLVDYRHFPLLDQGFDRAAMEQFLQESVLFRNRLGHGQGQLLLAGALATPEVVEQARELGFAAELLSLTIGHRHIPPAFVPVVAFALRAGKKVDDRCFNLRQGDYAYHGEADILKKTLFSLGGLLAASLVIFALATVLGYRDKRRQADALLQQMTRQYQQVFPGSKVTVDVALQMQSKLQELRNRAAALGIDTPPRPLAILKALSSLVEHNRIEVEDLSCDQDGCTLTATTDSFDAVNRIKDQLAASTLFTKVEVGETRKEIDGNNIEFRLRLSMAAEGGKR